MPLTEEQHEELTDILTGAAELDAKLTPWEARFVQDMRDREAKWGRKIMVSDKQWAILRRVQEEKLS